MSNTMMEWVGPLCSTSGLNRMSTSGIIDRVRIKGTLTPTATVFDEAFPNKYPKLR